MFDQFLQHTTLIQYSPKQVAKAQYNDIAAYQFDPQSDKVYWLNTYGLNEFEAMRQIIDQNDFDDFLIKLFKDSGHANKVIELDNVLFIALQVLKTDEKNLSSEQMIFVVSANVLWSIQENTGTYFEWIRERILQGRGLVQHKKVDYLMFLIIESLIASYLATFENMINNDDDFLHVSTISPTPQFTEQVEQQKRHMLNFKKATLSLRNTIVKLQSINSVTMESKYFIELKEQANNLIGEIDFELFELDSKINLIFSVQGHRLNESMRLLTIISVVFIPLTFLAGVYGMNFDYMPELKWHYGYFMVLGIMASSAIFIVVFFKHKKWL